MALKRHQALQDYSREHHDELLLVWKIREGIRKNISGERIKEYCINHYNELTSLHMQKEENYILTKLPEQDEDRIKILNDHEAIKKLIQLLSEDSSVNYDLLSEFAVKLEAHIRYEERTFFPKLQETLSDDDIKSMQPSEEKLKECIWKDPFWEN